MQDNAVMLEDSGGAVVFVRQHHVQECLPETLQLGLTDAMNVGQAIQAGWAFCGEFQ